MSLLHYTVTQMQISVNAVANLHSELYKLSELIKKFIRKMNFTQLQAYRNEVIFKFKNESLDFDFKIVNI